MKKDSKSASAGKGTRVEGEGSYAATRRYNEGVKRSVAEGKSKELAEKAAAALSGPEGPELKRAERIAKKGHPKLSSARR